jgi:hypothetical protein
MRMMGHPVGATFSNKSASNTPVHFGMKVPSKAVCTLAALLAGCGATSDSHEQKADAESYIATLQINKPATDISAFNDAFYACRDLGGELKPPGDWDAASPDFDTFVCTTQAGKNQLDVDKLQMPPEIKEKLGPLKKLYFLFVKPPQMPNPENDKGISF